MKTIFTGLLMLFLTVACSPIMQQEAIFKDSLRCNGSHAEIMSRAKLWLVKNVRNNANPVFFEDQNRIIAKGQLEVNNSGTRRFTTVYYSMEVIPAQNNVEVTKTIINREDISHDHGDEYKNIRFEFTSMNRQLEEYLLTGKE